MLPQTTITLGNISVGGSVHPSKIDVDLDGAIRRSIGASGDQVVLSVKITDWPAGFDDHGDFQINMNEGQGAGSSVTLGGYRLKSKLPVGIGQDPDNIASAAQPTHYRILLESHLRSLRDGYGGLITERTLNPLNEEGQVDTDHDDYKTNQQLVDICLDAIGLDHEAAPASLNLGIDGETVDAPGPLDWGNARPIDELEAIISRLGFTTVQLNDGTIAVRRLLRAGEAVNIPSAIQAVAEPYELGSMPGIRGSKMIVTSGTTRSTIMTSRSLGSSRPLVWLIYDNETDKWVEHPETALADYKAGLKADQMTPEKSKELGQLYRAVGLSGDDYLKNEANQFVNIPTNLDLGDYANFAGAPGVVEATCCIKSAGDQLLNVPTLDGTFARIDGLRAINGKGVFVLPPDAEFVRVDGFDSGRRSDVRELVGDELTITFAHESNRGVFHEDYFVVGFELSVDNGVITVNTLEHSDVIPLLDDPEVVKVADPTLRRVMTLDDVPEGSKTVPSPVSLNSDELVAIAKQKAVARMAGSLVQSGGIVLRGLIDINPGDIDGAVSSVIWNPFDHTTMITINQHEAPRSFYQKLQRASGESVTSGIGALKLNRSSASIGDLRHSMIATDSGVGVAASPESNPKQRGRERATAGVQGSQDAGPKVMVDRPAIHQQSGIYAMITASNSLGGNRWEYDWSEVRFVNGVPTATGSSRSSATHGKAINTMEMANSASGVQGNGVDVSNLQGTFEVQPISNTVVKLDGPFNQTPPIWFFQAPNGVDGDCS